MALAACGGGSGSGGGGSGAGSGGGATTYSIGGAISGLSASGLTLSDNGTDKLSIPSGTNSFTFATQLQSGATYDVTVAAQPAGEACSVSSGTGTVAGNVTSVTVACAAQTFTISGTISGLSGSGLQLQYYSGGQVLPVSAGATTFAFSQPVPSGTMVKMVVVTQPYWQQCNPGASNFSGVITQNITTDTLSCAAASANVTTLAGSPTAGSANGTGSAASFNGPSGVAVDSSGNIYVADSTNNEIRKITPAGVVTTLAGSTTAGHADGTGAAASFYSPHGVAVDSSGNVYVADTNNNEIRKINPEGVVTTFAGSTTPGHADGLGSAASFSLPYGVAVDSAGDAIVADTGNDEIRMITPTGDVTTLAGSPSPGCADGTGSAASFNTPTGVAVDSSGNVYVADFANNEIREITPAGVVTTLAGSTTSGHADGAGSAASFYNPTSVTVDSLGDIYVTDINNYEIRKVTGAGVVTTVAGSTAAGSADGTGSAASFEFPYGIAIVEPSGVLYVSDFGNSSGGDEIRQITPGP